MAEATGIEELREKLAYARERLEAANEAMRAADRKDYRVKRLEARIAEIERPRLAREGVLGAVLIHDGISWRKVVRIRKGR